MYSAKCELSYDMQFVYTFSNAAHRSKLTNMNGDGARGALRVTREILVLRYSYTVIPPYFADFGMKKSGLKNREIGGREIGGSDCTSKD